MRLADVTLTLALALALTLTLTLTLALTLTRCGQTRTEGAGCKPSAVHTLAGLAPEGCLQVG